MLDNTEADGEGDGKGKGEEYGADVGFDWEVVTGSRDVIVGNWDETTDGFMEDEDGLIIGTIRLSCITKSSVSPPMVIINASFIPPRVTTSSSPRTMADKHKSWKKIEWLSRFMKQALCSPFCQKHAYLCQSLYS